MDPSDKPEAYGVFKPVGHVMVAFPDADGPDRATEALVAQGFASGDITLYSPEQMQRQADADIAGAGVLASIGQELNLVKAHRELAEKGHSFLVVKAPDEDSAWKVADIARGFGAVRAQRYGRLIIEELIEPGQGDKQVGESPDRGLDAQTLDGAEPSAGQQPGGVPAPLEGHGGGLATEQRVSSDQVRGR